MRLRVPPHYTNGDSKGKRLFFVKGGDVFKIFLGIVLPFSLVGWWGGGSAYWLGLSCLALLGSARLTCSAHKLHAHAHAQPNRTTNQPTTSQQPANQQPANNQPTNTHTRNKINPLCCLALFRIFACCLVQSFKHSPK